MILYIYMCTMKIVDRKAMIRPVNFSISISSGFLSGHADIHWRLQEDPCRQRGEAGEGHQQRVYRPGGVHHGHRAREERISSLRETGPVYRPESKVISKSRSICRQSCNTSFVVKLNQKDRKCRILKTKTNHIKNQ